MFCFLTPCPSKASLDYNPLHTALPAGSCLLLAREFAGVAVSGCFSMSYVLTCDSRVGGAAPKWEETFPHTEELVGSLPAILYPGIHPHPQKLTRGFIMKGVLHVKKKGTESDLQVRRTVYTHTHTPSCNPSASSFLLCLEENVIRSVPSDELGRQIPQCGL